MSNFPVYVPISTNKIFDKLANFYPQMAVGYVCFACQNQAEYQMEHQCSFKVHNNPIILRPKITNWLTYNE